VAAAASDDVSLRGALFLLDGSSLAFRAFFALPETISTRDGLPTNALYGMSQMLLKLVDEYEPGALVIAWDAREKTFRHDEFEEYKAHRPQMPELLSQQWPLLRDLVAAFGIPDLEKAGYEADDLLGSLAVRASHCGLRSVVVTGDRDALQLVADDVAVMATGRGITDVKVYSPATVVDRYGVTPDRVPDFIGLKGDSSDNIPGVPGIGEKTAAHLLQQFGSIEALYERLDEVTSEKRRALLVEHEAAARLSKRLATMVLDVPVDIDLAELIAAGPYRVPLASVEDIFRRFEFGSLVRRLRARAVGAPTQELADAPRRGVEEHPAGPPPSVTLEDGAGPLAALLEQRPCGFAAVALTDGSGFATAICDGGSRVPAAVVKEEALRGLWRAAAHVVGHDVKAQPHYDAAPTGPAADTLVGAYLLAPERPEGDLRILADVDVGWAVLPPEGTTPVVAAAVGEAATRAVLAQRVAAAQEPQLEELDLGRLYRECELPLVRVLAVMEAAGVRIDTYRLGEITARLHDQVEELEDRVHELAGGPFTIGSPKQLAEVLFSRLGLQPVRKGKTGYSTDARVLATLREQHPIVPDVEEWRELTKLLNTYLEPLPTYVDTTTGRLHTTFNQTVAATGRLSSSNPNLQNIPVRSALGAEIRSCFVAEEGSQLVVADYSQIELRLMASFAQEPAMLDAFRRGEDVHRTTAAAVAGIPVDEVTPQQRERAKATNFGIMYGLSAFGLSEQVGMTVEEAREFIAAYFARYPHVRAFRDRVILQAAEDGHVRTVLGRRRAIPELRSGVQRIRSLGERLAVNSVLQGSAADIIKLAMIRAQNQLELRALRARLVLQVHDELVFEAPEAEVGAVMELAREAMIGAYVLDPPLDVHVGAGSNWRDAK
jgi:DNA polymerase-1